MCGSIVHSLLLSLENYNSKLIRFIFLKSAIFDLSIDIRLQKRSHALLKEVCILERCTAICDISCDIHILTQNTLIHAYLWSVWIKKSGSVWVKKNIGYWMNWKNHVILLTDFMDILLQDPFLSAVFSEIDVVHRRSMKQGNPLAEALADSYLSRIWNRSFVWLSKTSFSECVVNEG